MFNKQYELENINKVIHLSDSDFDGVGALHLSDYFFGKHLEAEQIHTEPIRRTTLDEKVLSLIDSGGWTKDTLLLITDIGVSDEVAETIETYHEEGYMVRLIDHHETANRLNKYDWAVVKSTSEKDGEKRLESATTLFLEFLHEDFGMKPVPVLSHYAELVRLYDTWDWHNVLHGEGDGKLAKSLNDLLHIFGIPRFREVFLERILALKKLGYKQMQLGEDETFLLELEEMRIKDTFKKKKSQIVFLDIEVGDKPYHVGMVSVESYHSELGNLLNEEFPECDLIIMFDVGAGKISFRTIHEHIRVNDVAKHFDGGGHPKAAGCTLAGDAYYDLFLLYGGKRFA